MTDFPLGLGSLLALSQVHCFESRSQAAASDESTSNPALVHAPKPPIILMTSNPLAVKQDSVHGRRAHRRDVFIKHHEREASKTFQWMSLVKVQIACFSQSSSQ